MTSRRTVCVAAALILPLLASCGHDEVPEVIGTMIEARDVMMAEQDFTPVLELFTGSLDQSETEDVGLDLDADAAYQIFGLCDEHCGDIDLALYGPDGSEMASDAASDAFPRLQATPAEAGRYRLEVTMYSCDEEPCYWGARIYARQQRDGRSGPGVQAEAGRLEAGDETLDSGKYVDYYTFTGSQGEDVVVDLRSNDFDPYLIVIRPDDSQDENDDWQGDIARSLLRLSLPMDGEYRVLVTSYAPDEVGAYDLTIQRNVGSVDQPVIAESGTLASGDETLSSGQYGDRYSFEGQPGEHVHVDLTSDDFDTYVMLLGPGEFRVENDDWQDDIGHSVVDADLLDSGVYDVYVTSYAVDETGSYDLRIERGAATATEGQRDVHPLLRGQPSTGVLEAGDGERETGQYRDLWVFDAEAGETVSLELTSGDFDTYLTLLSPEGDVVDENDDADGRLDLSRIVATLPQGGRYRAAVSSYLANETGSYALTLSSGNGDSRENAIAGGGTVYGIFVGVSDYGGRVNDLAYTADDAVHASEALSEGADMSPENAIVLTDSQATTENVRAAFEEMSQQVGPEDTFVYFFSGHGNRVPSDGEERADPDGLDETIELYDDAMRDNELSDLFGLLDARVSLMILDSCFSGGFSKDVISAPRRMGLFSSEEDVTSQVAAKFRAGGYLSQFLADAVGERLADADGDGAINAIELSQYIHERYRADVKSTDPDDYVETEGPQSGFQHFVVDRGSIAPDDILFR